jgi:hypothetical protein
VKLLLLPAVALRKCARKKLPPRTLHDVLSTATNKWVVVVGTRKVFQYEIYVPSVLHTGVENYVGLKKNQKMLRDWLSPLHDSRNSGSFYPKFVV